MFITALFTIAKTWKQPRCLSTDEWVMRCEIIYIYMEYYSAIKKELNFAICNNMDGHKSERERQILLCYHLYMESKK